MKIDDLLFDQGPDIFYDEDFRNVIEDHMTYLRTHPETTVVLVAAGRAYRYESDFYGLLQFLNVPGYLHWVVLRMNRMTSPEDFSPDVQQLLVPNSDVLERMRVSHMSTRVLS